MANVEICMIQNIRPLPPYTCWAINAIPVGSASPRTGFRCAARMEMPRKHTPRMVPITTMVLAAFFDSGFLKAGTPLLTASTPESATAPDENARSSIMSPNDLVPLASSSASLLTLAGSMASMFFSTNTRTSPTTMSTMSDTT